MSEVDHRAKGTALSAGDSLAIACGPGPASEGLAAQIPWVLVVRLARLQTAALLAGLAVGIQRDLMGVPGLSLMSAVVPLQLPVGSWSSEVLLRMF